MYSRECACEKMNACLQGYSTEYIPVLCKCRQFLKITFVVLIAVKIEVACVCCSGEVYLELLCGVDAAAEERGRIWVHFSTLYGSWKDSFGW